MSLVLDEFLVEWISSGHRPICSVVEWVRDELMPTGSGKRYSRLGLGGKAFLRFSVRSHWPWFVLWGHAHLLVTQSCPTICDRMDCSPPGFSVLGILQARILEWIAIPFSRGSSWPRDRNQASCIKGRFFTAQATREVPFALWISILPLSLPSFLSPSHSSSFLPSLFFFWFG